MDHAKWALPIVLGALVFLTAPARVDGAALLLDDADVRVWWEDASVKVPRYASDNPSLGRGRGANDAITVSAARNESEPVQIVVTPKRRGLTVESITTSDLRTASGSVLGRANIRTYNVGYVNEKFADVLMPVDLYPSVPANENYAVWVLVHVPTAVAAGDYSGTVDIKLAGREAIRVPITVRVWGFALPERTHVFTQLFGINIELLAARYGVDVWSPELERLVTQMYEMMAERRISPARATPLDFRRIGRVPDLVAGRHGQAGRFDGESMVDVPARPERLVTDRFTVMGWVKAQRRRGRQPGWIYRNIYDEVGIGFGVDAEHRLVLEIGDGDKFHPVQSRGTVDEQWRHVAVTFDRGDVRFFIDGRPEAPIRAPLATARKGWHSFNVGQKFRGDLDDVRVFDKPLGDAAVAEMMAKAGGVADAVLAVDFEKDPFANQYLKTLYDKATIEYFEKWVKFWLDRGLYLGAFYVPEDDEQELRKYLATWYPILKRMNVLDRMYVRLPHDEASVGPKAEANRKWAKIIRELAPEIRIHQTFGAARKAEEKEEAFGAYAGLVDVWAFRPDIERRGNMRQFFAKREAAGDRVSPYIHQFMGLDDPATVPRLFFWQLMAQGRSMCTWWRVNHWDRPPKLPSRKEKLTTETERGFIATNDGGSVGAGNGVGFWPGKNQVYPTIRLEMVREGIEDFEYRWLLRERIASARPRSTAERKIVEDARALTALPREISGALAAQHVPTRFANPAPLHADRTRVAEALVRLESVGR